MAANPWGGFVGQCVGWVRTVLPWVPGGPANAYQYASDRTLTNVGATQVAPSSAQPGDVVVWPAGVGGSDGNSGHIAVVSSVLSNGVQVSQANWGENGLPSTMTIPFATLSQLDVYAPPPNQQASSATRAELSALGLPSSGSLGSGSAGRPSSGIVLASSPGAGRPTPDKKLWYGTAFLPDGPYLHTLWKLAFTGGALMMIWMGFNLMKGNGLRLPSVPGVRL